MPTDQIVDIDVDADILVLLKIADVRTIACRAAVDQSQLGFIHQERAVADLRVVVDAALKARLTRSGDFDLANELKSSNASLLA